jgi:ABC-type transport system involved in multi-copper enzyme maturation permease subunit
LGLFSFSALAVGLTFAAGCICGAGFNSAHLGVLKSVGFFLLVFLASAGIGMLIGTFIKNGLCFKIM